MKERFSFPVSAKGEKNFSRYFWSNSRLVTILGQERWETTLGRRCVGGGGFQRGAFLEGRRNFLELIQTEQEQSFQNTLQKDLSGLAEKVEI
jgi:hypothetical protein